MRVSGIHRSVEPLDLLGSVPTQKALVERNGRSAADVHHDNDWAAGMLSLIRVHLRGVARRLKEHERHE
jgi:hypothetical protein